MVKFTLLFLVLLTSCVTSVEKEDPIAKKFKNLDSLRLVKKNFDWEKTPGLIDNFTEKWGKIKSTEGKFSIEFPDYEIENKENVQTFNNNKITVHNLSQNLEDVSHLNVGYALAWNYCPEISSEEEISTLFIDQKEHIKSSLNCSLESEFITDSLKFPSRDFLFAIDNSNLKCRYRLYFNDGVLYKLTILTEDGKHSNKSISKFLNSFKIYN